MSCGDLMRLAWQAVWSHRQRSVLTMLGVLIGIASVILLTSIGEGTRLYVLSEFTQFGTTLAGITPGRLQTTGMPGALGITIHPLTIEDAAALERIRGVQEVVPVVMGTAPVEHEGKIRHTFVYGVTAAGPGVWRMRVRSGRFLPKLEPHRSAPVAVLGPLVKRELFGEGNSLGRYVRIAGQRFMVIGVMEPKGQFLGFDIDDSVYVPVAAARQLFNREALQEIDVLIANASLIAPVVARIRETLIARHNDTEDFTITTQTGMLETLDRILRIVNMAVGGIGAISLLVGSIGILTIMWISVNERTSEIGLARALGATSQQVLWLFLAEAALLSTCGGGLGIAAGIGLAQLLHAYVPALPVETPAEYVGLALVVSLAVGLASGILPAQKAARLDPVLALAAE
ncbi:MAG: ABC transporter permease [Verrucomicrobia bacterium]|nr:ABC transporter permease [Verrucomicrobiota bacterium]